MRVGWVTGTDSVADPRVAQALGDTAVDELTLVAPALTPVSTHSAGGVTVVVGEVVGSVNEQLLVEANVDDTEPRLWPGALQALLGAGAADAWLTPIIMKKGRPAHTVSVLVDGGRLDAVTTVLLAQTTTIGFRVTPVRKHALPREEQVLRVRGQQIRVKVVPPHNAMPEWDDVAAAAAATGLPAKRILAEAQAAALDLWG